jgi:5S rRNA maturation endonuclease (ribonuclease M5)
MLKRTNLVFAIVAIAVAVATLVMMGTVIAQTKAAVPKPQDKLALGEEEVKQLLLLMDTDKNGRISKAEYMKFMEAEFDRLDKDKSGDLDVNEITQSKLRVSHASVGR